MTRGRMTTEAENVREELEGDLALLGNLIVRTELVQVRLDAGVHVAPGLLLPAVSDLGEIRKLAKRVQTRIHTRMVRSCQS